MKKRLLFLIVAMILGAFVFASAEEMLVIEWVTPEPESTPTPDPTPTPTPEPTPGPYGLNVPLPSVDWSNNAKERYFLILTGGDIGDSSVKDLMLWLSDEYAIPSITYRLDGGALGERVKGLLEEDGEVSAVLAYGYDWLEHRDTVACCTGRNTPLWFSERTDFDGMAGELDAMFAGVYVKKAAASQGSPGKPKR